MPKVQTHEEVAELILEIIRAPHGPGWFSKPLLTMMLVNETGLPDSFIHKTIDTMVEEDRLHHNQHANGEWQYGLFADAD